MRWLAGVVAAACVSAVGVGIGRVYQERLERAQRLDHTADAVTRLQRELAVRSATKTAACNERGYPTTVDPAWFKDGYPVNELLDDDHPWLEVAGEEEAELTHPSVRVAVKDDTPTLWYNPYLGVVRARVPVSVSDEDALAAYNKVNGSNLTSLFWKEPVASKHEAEKAAAAAAAAEVAKDEMFANAHPPRKPGKYAPGASRGKKRKSEAVIVVHRDGRAPVTTPAPPPQTADAGE